MYYTLLQVVADTVKRRIVNGEFYNGNVFERKKEVFETEEEAEVFLQKLNVFSWLWAKEFFDVKTNKYIVKYPYFFIENKKELKN